MLSEEQWRPIGTCPDCGDELYKIGNRIAYHDCNYDRMDELVMSIRKLNKLVNDIDTMPKTAARVVKDYLKSG